MSKIIKELYYTAHKLVEKSGTWFIQCFQLTLLGGLLIAYCLSETLKGAGSKMQGQRSAGWDMGTKP